MLDLNQLTTVAIQEMATTPTAVTTATGQSLTDLRSQSRPKTTQTGVAFFKETMSSKAGKTWFIYEFKSATGPWFSMMSQKDLGNNPIQYSNAIFGLGIREVTKQVTDPATGLTSEVKVKVATLFA